jgi:hypothetical protein
MATLAKIKKGHQSYINKQLKYQQDQQNLSIKVEARRLALQTSRSLNTDTGITIDDSERLYQFLIKDLPK